MRIHILGTLGALQASCLDMAQIASIAAELVPPRPPHVKQPHRAGLRPFPRKSNRCELLPRCLDGIPVILSYCLHLLIGFDVVEVDTAGG